MGAGVQSKIPGQSRREKVTAKRGSHRTGLNTHEPAAGIVLNEEEKVGV